LGWSRNLGGSTLRLIYPHALQENLLRRRHDILRLSHSTISPERAQVFAAFDDSEEVMMPASRPMQIIGHMVP
jgi:hypothetical protein